MAEEPKKVWTEEERIALATKLDKELDDFIDTLPKKKYEDGWKEDNWEEEFDKHPFFMKKTPEPGDELHPLYEGLQQLKYDPSENTPEELANSYKDDGNFNFKHKNYRLAIISYTEGIKVKCNVPDIEASLHNNRSAANWFLKNYRSCVRDCELALKYKPKYNKVVLRAANACFEMTQYEKSIDFCDQILADDKNNAEMLQLRQKCTIAAKNKERDVRKREAALRKKNKEESDLVNAIKERGIKIEGPLNMVCLVPKIPALENHRVFLNAEQKLVWPVTFMYPQYQMMDFLQQFTETQTLSDHLRIVFDETPVWDKNCEYKPTNLNVYCENHLKSAVFKIDITKTLLDILKLKSFVVRGGTPAFIIVISNSATEKGFLQKYNNK